ncbi:niemann-Pick type C1 disease protein [Cryptosporidium ryanae]|uniref:niemann-Pick type C1 disease protein n=1 Tax=Cryptosporidium ryanae TaxID=515981 RepID=UPI00351A3212|nr:niemann-Pick type C1 disease protein [Cryptosporidium ryanae]
MSENKHESMEFEVPKSEFEIPQEESSGELRSKNTHSVSEERVFRFDSHDSPPEFNKSLSDSSENVEEATKSSKTGFIAKLKNLFRKRSLKKSEEGTNLILSFLNKFSSAQLFDKYTKRIGKNISLIATMYPRSLLIIGNVFGLFLGLIVALGIMKFPPFYLEVNGSPDLFLPERSIYNVHKEQLKALFGPESVNVPILYSNKGPSGSSLLDYMTLKQIWKNEMSIQAIRVVDKNGKEWGWEDICLHQPTGATLTGAPCIVLSIFGLFLINDSNGIFSEDDFDSAYTGECCSGISIAKFAAGNFIKQSYYPYQYKYDSGLEEWPFEIANTQEMLSIYRLNTTIPEDVRIAWENKVTDFIKSIQKRNRASQNLDVKYDDAKSQAYISESMYRNNSAAVNPTTGDVGSYPNNWSLAHFSSEYISSETTELANKETPLLLATFALMIIFMAVCISGRFPRKSRILLSSTVVLITVYATVGSFATGMIFGVPISPLTPLFIHMLLGVVVSYMIISVRTYQKTRIYIRVPYTHLPLLNPKYVRLSGNDVFLEITQYIYKPWNGFLYSEDGNFHHSSQEVVDLNTEIPLENVWDGNIVSRPNESEDCNKQLKSEGNSPCYENPDTDENDGIIGPASCANYSSNTDYLASNPNDKNSVLSRHSSNRNLPNSSEELLVPTFAVEYEDSVIIEEKKMWESETLLKIRLSVSGSVAFSSISLTCLTSCAALFLGTIVDFPIVRYYCIHAGFGILYLFIFHWLIFLPSFSLDEKRIYKRKFDVFPMLKFKIKNKPTSYLYKNEEQRSVEIIRTGVLNTPSNTSSVSVSDDSRKGTILSAFTRHVYKVRREVVKNYQRYKTWWGDKSTSSVKSDVGNRSKLEMTIINESGSVLNKKVDLSGDECEHNSFKAVSKSDLFGKLVIKKAIGEIDLKDIWIGRLMVESSKADVIMRLMCNFSFRVFACFFFILTVIIGLIYSGRVNTEFSSVRYLPPNSPLHHFVETLASRWGSEPRQMYVVVPGNDKVSWNQRKVRTNFMNLVDNILLKDPAVMEPIVSWVHDFEYYHFGSDTINDPNHIPSFVRECSSDMDVPRPPLESAPKEEFYEFLSEWRNRKVTKDENSQEDTICVVSTLNTKINESNIVNYAPFVKNVIPEMHNERMLVFNNGDPKQGIQAFRIMAMIKHDPLNSQDNYETMVRLNNLIDTVFNKDFPGTYLYSDWFVDAERDKNILNIVWKLLLYITIGVSIMLCIIQNPLTGIFIGLVVGGINIVVMLIMYITGLIFDIVAFMVLATAVSFSIEYIVHITHLFLLTKRDSGVERIRDSLLDMGPNVIYAVISSFLGIILLAFSTSEAFKVFLWITTIVLCISATTGIMIAPAMLSISLDFWNFIRDYYKKGKKMDEISI